MRTRQGKNSKKDDHKWTKGDCIVGLYYYRWGTKFLDISDQEVADIIGTTVASMRMKKGNYQAIEKGHGLEHYSQTEKEVFKQYGKSLRYTVYKEVSKHLKLDEIKRNQILNRGGRRLKALR
jgi:hypothetical protein